MKNRHLLSIVIILLVGIITAYGQSNTITIPNVSVAKGKTISLPVNMDNTADIVAVQFTLTVPDGITIIPSSATLTERSDGHVVTFKSIAANKYMAMIHSSKNNAIKGRTGKLMSISLTASTNLEEGTVHPLSLSDVVLGARDGSNLATGYNAGEVTIATLPDLVISNVETTESVLSPGDKINVKWTVSNIGGLPTNAGWSEQILLKNNQGTTKLLGTMYYEETLNSEGAVSRSVELNVPYILSMDGDCNIVVKLIPNSNAGEPSWLQNNNINESPNPITVLKELLLSPENANIEESNSNNVRFQLSRSGDISNDEIFSIVRNADNRITLPETVTIAKDQSSTYFYAQVSANAELDNDSIVRFTISGNSYPEISSFIKIEDDTYPSLNILTDEQDVTEGGAINFIVSTQRISQSDIEVKMTCDLASHFRIPTNIVIPAGHTNVEVTVETIEDDVPNVNEVVTFTVTAARHNPSSINTTLVDNDIPTLQFDIAPSAISESAGPLAVTAKLRRTDNIDKVVTVKLSDDSDGGIYYGRETITMEKGIEEAIVNLGPIDNAIVDGERTYNISAAVWIASCSCNATNGKTGGFVSSTLTVYDNDGPTLTMTSSSSILNEGSEITVTVARNTNSSNSLDVNISSDHEADLEFPNKVTIPSGETKVSFAVRSKGNEITGDGFTATLNATAEGFATGNVWFNVSDQTLPDAQITDFSISSDEIEAGGSIIATVTIANTGSYALPELTKVGIYINNSSSAVTTIYLQNSLQPGENVVMTREVTVPSSIGSYKVFAIANDGNDVKELNITNNTSKMLDVKTISPFAVTITSDKNIYKSGEKALISGSITGTDPAGKEVEVYIINNNYRHVINTMTDNNGTFSVEYVPFPGQMGHFVAGACYPKEGLHTEMTTFDYIGIKRVSNSAITCEALLGETYSGNYRISNPSNLPLTNVSVEVVSKPENCNVTVSCPTNVNANSEFSVEYTIDATSVSEGNDWQLIEIVVKSDEGASLATTLYYYCRNKQGQLKANIARINTTMIKGTSRDYPFTVTNIGKGETGKITLELPSWMSSVTPREMASIENGESTTIILRLTPTEDMQLNVPVSGSIGLNCSNGEGLSLPFYIEPVSETTGTLIIDVCDENTYYTAEKPHLAGASVIVTHPTNGATITSGITGEDGKFEIVLPEGYYTVSVSAPHHNSYRDNLLIDPGVENVKTVNLSIEAITVDWKVEETTVEDEYSIVTTVSYETNVPVPVVELKIPQSINAKDLPEGESLIFYATMTNKGLITAEDVQLELPTGFRAIEFEALSNNTPFSLAPQQSVNIPVKVTHVDASMARANARREKPIDNDPCVGQVGTLYYWDCGTDRKWHRYGVALQLGSCKSDDPSTWDNSGNGTYGGYGGGPSFGPGFGGGGPSFGPGSGGGGYYGSSSGSTNVPTHQDEGCEPCQNKFLIDLVDCGLQLVPAYKVLKSVLNCVGSIRKLIGTTQSGNAKDIAFGTLEAATSCIAAKRAGAGDKNATRQAEREQALEDILLTLSSLKAKQGQGESIEGEDIIETLGSLASSLSTLAGWDFDHVEEIFCPVKLFLPCDLEGNDDGGSDSAPSKRSKTKAATETATPSYVTEFRQNLAYPFIQQLTLIGLRYEFFGDADWMNVDQDQLYTFFDAFKASQNSDGIVSEEYYKTLIDVKPESISRDQVIKFVKRWNNTLNEKSDEPHFDCNKISGYYDMIEYVNSAIVDKGFESVAELYETSFEKCKAEAEESKSVCASISLQFSQKMVMTRQAFRGKLTVFNGNETTAMTDVKLELIVKDEVGNVTTTHEFQINPETLTGFEGNLNLTDGWTLGAQQTGVATVIFIPTKYAAPTVERQYSFGGTLSYVDPFIGLTVTRDLFPVTLTVKPSPNLNLTYFMQRDIKGDDPLTEEIEPSEEAEFSLLINNIGYGDATDVRMYTEQPKIIDNEKGLLIDFELISSQLNGGEKTLALGGTVATDFGTIPALSTSYAQWWIMSSLLGHFTDYNVEATHVTSYDNPDLSLLNDVTIHELIRSIDVEYGNAKVVGFMTNDIADAEDMPDMLYLSNGEIETVSLAQNINICKVSDTDYSLTVSTIQNGWNYGNIVDPTYGVSALRSVVRQSDGKEMPLRNFWQTDRTLRDGKDPLYENRIHFADNMISGEEETYILTFEPMPELQLEVASIENVPEEGILSTEPISIVKVMFNKYIEPSTFSTDDISLALQGVKQDVSSVVISTEDNKIFTLDFTELNKTVGNGYFVLSVNTSDVKDTDGYLGKNGKQVGWIMFRDGLVRLNTSTYPISAGLVQKLQAPSEAKTQNAMLTTEESVEYGSMLKLTTIPNEGYEFINWTVNGEVVSTDINLEYMALEDMDIKANYSLKTYSVIINENIEGGIIIGAASGVYSYGDVLNLTASANEDYIFGGWVVNDQKVSEDQNYSIVVDGAKEITAYFVRDIFLQSLLLSRGWNWVSSYINEPIPVNSFFGNVTHIVSQFDEVINDPIYGMIGTIETLVPGQAYKMDVSYNAMKSFKGHLHNLVETPIDLHKGWNWIAFPYFEDLSINTAIANAEEGDFMVSQRGFSEYAEGLWEGTLSTLSPGEGYLYKSASDKILSFDFTSNGIAGPTMARTIAANDRNMEAVDIHLYPNTMNMTIQVYKDEIGLLTEELYIYAFASDELRGTSQQIGNNHYLTVYGDEPVDISFVVESASTSEMFAASETLEFHDDVVGSRKSPFILHIDNAMGIYSLYNDNCPMTVYNLEGILIRRDATLTSLNKLPKGVYIVNGHKCYIK